jgi:phage shock protein A
MDQKTIRKIKNDQQCSLLEELLREKASVLARAGWAVEDVLDKLARLERDIEKKITSLNASAKINDGSALLRQKENLCEEINCQIEEYNSFCRKAHLQYYYLIVTREALGLRRHEMVQKIYRIPEKKKRIKVFHG